MIKYSHGAAGPVAIVENIKTGEKFHVSTARNQYGVYETAVFKAPNQLMGVINAFTGRALFIVNSSTTQQAEQSHIRTAELFEQLDPKDMIRKYKKEGRIGAQLFMSNKTQTDDKFRFWSNIQGLTIFLVPILFVFCFISSWWFLIPALLFLVLNAVAYAKRMKLLGRNPATRDINDVV